MRPDATDSEDGAESGQQLLNRQTHGEFATERALQLFDEIGLRLLEIRLVLDFVAEDVMLRLDDFYPPLEALEQVAHDAVGAAGLLHAGAELEQPWGHLPSRPKAVFARHGAAVRRGATSVTVPASSHSRFNDVLDALAQPFPPLGSTSGPQCPAMISDGSRRCSRRALYIGKNRFGTACYTHASEEERRLNQEFIDANTPSAADEAKHGLCCALGMEIAEMWLKERDAPGSLHYLVNAAEPGEE